MTNDLQKSQFVISFKKNIFVFVNKFDFRND